MLIQAEIVKMLLGEKPVTMQELVYPGAWDELNDYFNQIHPKDHLYKIIHNLAIVNNNLWVDVQRCDIYGDLGHRVTYRNVFRNASPTSALKYLMHAKHQIDNIIIFNVTSKGSKIA